MSNHAAVLGALAPSQREHVINLEDRIKAWREQALKQLPRHVRALSPILRRAVHTHRVRGLQRWCYKHGFDIPRRQLPLFRDCLITQLIDLKDLEPDARARLRYHWLAQQDASVMTDAYLAGSWQGADLRCRDCHWFVTAPEYDDCTDRNFGKSCVELGTKGVDAACFGFEPSKPALQS